MKGLSMNEISAENENNKQDRASNKDNKTFLLLSVFGIIFFVLGHCSGINVFF